MGLSYKGIEFSIREFIKKCRNPDFIPSNLYTYYQHYGHKINFKNLKFYYMWLKDQYKLGSLWVGIGELLIVIPEGELIMTVQYENVIKVDYRLETDFLSESSHRFIFEYTMQNTA